MKENVSGCFFLNTVYSAYSQCAKQGSTFGGVTIILRHGSVHARGFRGPDSGPISLIVTCFDAVFKILLKQLTASSMSIQGVSFVWKL